jgi:hypothetical protein
LIEPVADLLHGLTGPERTSIETERHSDAPTGVRTRNLRAQDTVEGLVEQPVAVVVEA